MVVGRTRKTAHVVAASIAPLCGYIVMESAGIVFVQPCREPVKESKMKSRRDDTLIYDVGMDGAREICTYPTLGVDGIGPGGRVDAERSDKWRFYIASF